MANKYRGVTWNNAGAGPKVRVRRSIWLAELEDFGLVTDDTVDLPTRGATHRGSLGATSGTRGYVNLSTVNDLAVVDTQDHGLITDTAVTAAWKTNPENTNVVTPATPTYSVSHNAGTSADEGDSVTFTLTTTNVANGTTLYFTVSYVQNSGGYTDSNDFSGANAGPVTVNNNTASFTVTLAEDSSTESGSNQYEGFIGNFGTSYAYADILASSGTIEINDTSTAASPSYAYSVKLVGSVSVATLQADSAQQTAFAQWYGGGDYTNGSIFVSTTGIGTTYDNVWDEFKNRVETSVSSWNGGSATSPMTSSNISIAVTITSENGYPCVYFESNNSDQVILWGDSGEGTLATLGFADIFNTTGSNALNGTAIGVQAKANNYTLTD